VKIQPFELERFFAKYEFSTRYLLSSSDPESLSLQDLLDWADDESLDLWQRLSLGYTESQGHPLLRQEIAALYERIAPQEVLVVAPEEGIFIAMNTVLEAGAHAIVTFPGYQSLYEIAHALGCGVTRWTLHPSGAGWDLDLGVLRAAITPETRLVVLNFPHNPTGYLPEREKLQEIVDLARQYGLYIFSDEMYRLLEYEAASRLPAMCDIYERGISLFGLSKTFALPGLRIGWLATRDAPLMRRLQAFKDYTTICSSAPSEVLAIMALRSRDRILMRNLGIIQGNLEVVERFVADHAAAFDWLRPAAGSVAFPRLTFGESPESFSRHLLAQQGVMVVPGSVFDYPGDHFRLGLGRANLSSALQCVAEYIEKGSRT
jgi:aspartate/methionine/tyrosine aminotransferase